MALDFDGVDDLVDCGSGAHLDDLAAWTWCAWVRPDTTGEGGLGIALSKPDKYFWGASSSSAANTFECQVIRATTNMNLAAVANTIVLAAWQFVAFTFDGTTGRLLYGAPGGAVAEVSYVVNTQGTGAINSDAANNLIIGNLADGSQTFDGRIADPRVFNAALSAAELTSVMYNRPARGENLRGWWRFEGGSPEPDWSGNAANGTVTGAVVADGPPIPAPFAGDDDYSPWAAAAAADTLIGQASL